MPSNQSPLGAHPARFRRERLLIVGCGDIGQRVAVRLRGRVQLLALTTQRTRVPDLRARSIRPLSGNLDSPWSVRRLAGLATRVLHLAPPAASGDRDRRTVNLVRALGRSGAVVRRFVYASTSGVYGHCEGEWISETRPIRPASARARRRADAEATVRHWGDISKRSCVLRIPGIYAADRPGGTPLARLQAGTPVLTAQDDVYTNHIHADDLARACLLALWRGKPRRLYHVADDSAMLMGDYYDLAADLYQLPRPARVERALMAQRVSPMQWSFMTESRRLRNSRIKKELGLRLRFPNVVSGLTERT